MKKENKGVSSHAFDDRWSLAGPPFWLLSIAGLVMFGYGLVKGQIVAIAIGGAIAVLCFGAHVGLNKIRTRTARGQSKTQGE